MSENKSTQDKEKRDEGFPSARFLTALYASGAVFSFILLLKPSLSGAQALIFLVLVMVQGFIALALNAPESMDEDVFED